MVDGTGAVCLFRHPHDVTLTVVVQISEREALDTLVYYHGCGDPQNPLVVYEYEEIRAAIAHEIIQRQTGWKDLFATKDMLRRVRLMVAIPFFSQWTGSGLMYVRLTIPDVDLRFSRVYAAHIVRIYQA